MKIALIAMSGIRACDPELLELGLTLPGFVERSRTIASLPSLGLLTLAGRTPREHEVHYFEIEDFREPAELPRGFDLVAISSFSAQIEEAYRVARHYRRIGAQVVLGGLHVTSVPEEAIACGASVVVGEGEAVWDDVLRDAANGRLAARYDARGKEVDLSEGPLPAFELLDIERYNRLTLQTSRGCPWRCSFCASSILLTGRYKQKSPERVLREIDRIREIWKRPFIELADDNAFVNAAYWKRLLPELARRQIRWFAESDVSIYRDDRLLRAMREAGCAEVLIGFESPVQAGLDGIELRRNWKKQQWPAYREAVRRIQAHGIRVNACFVLGLDGQTIDAFDEVRDFVEDAAPFDVQITYLTPFPNTPLYHRLKREGRLTHDGEWSRSTLFDVNYLPTHMTPGELQAGFRDLMRTLYSEPFTRWRKERFREMWRRGPEPATRPLLAGTASPPARG